MKLLICMLAMFLLGCPKPAQAPPEAPETTSQPNTTQAKAEATKAADVDSGASEQ